MDRMSEPDILELTQSQIWYALILDPLVTERCRDDFSLHHYWLRYSVQTGLSEH